MSAPAFTSGDIVQVAAPAGRWGGSLMIVSRVVGDIVEGFAQLHTRGTDPRFDTCRVRIDLVRPTGGRITLENRRGPARVDEVTAEPFYDDVGAWG